MVGMSRSSKRKLCTQVRPGSKASQIPPATFARMWAEKEGSGEAVHAHKGKRRRGERGGGIVQHCSGVASPLFLKEHRSGDGERQSDRYAQLPLDSVQQLSQQFHPCYCCRLISARWTASATTSPPTRRRTATTTLTSGPARRRRSPQ